MEQETGLIPIEMDDLVNGATQSGDWRGHSPTELNVLVTSEIVGVTRVGLDLSN